MGTKCDHHSLEDFGSDSYEESLSSIMFDYWRSYLAVKHIVEVHANNDVKAVFDAYHQWHEKGRNESLTDFFQIGALFD